MRIDASQRHWAIASAIILVLSAAAYHVYVYNSAVGARGGSPAGLAFGVLGFAFMLFAALLGARKKVPVWRLGRAQTWMRGHLWLGVLTLLLIIFHAGFAFRGALTAVLMLLLVIVVVSGILGAILQHYLPRMITSRVPMETIYEEIPHVRAQLREEAEQLVTTLAVEAEHDDKIQFRETYASAIRPFLDAPETTGSPVFDTIRRTTPMAFHPTLDDLENICEEELQLSRQRRLYHWLHV